MSRASSDGSLLGSAPLVAREDCKFSQGKGLSPIRAQAALPRLSEARLQLICLSGTATLPVKKSEPQGSPLRKNFAPCTIEAWRRHLGAQVPAFPDQHPPVPTGWDGPPHLSWAARQGSPPDSEPALNEVKEGAAPLARGWLHVCEAIILRRREKCGNPCAGKYFGG